MKRMIAIVLVAAVFGCAHGGTAIAPLSEFDEEMLAGWYFLSAIQELRRLDVREELRRGGGLDPETCGEFDRTTCKIYL